MLVGQDFQKQPGYRQEPFILRDSAKQYYWSGVSSASIKTFAGGTATYRLERGTERIQTGQFLLLNDGQPYEITIDGPHAVNSFCVFFPTGMAERTATELTQTCHARLDNPYGDGPSDRWKFLDHVYAPEPRIMARMNLLHERMSLFGHDKLWLHEQLQLLMADLIRMHERIWTAMERLPSARKSTRDELFRRVLMAHEWIQAYYRDDVTLVELSKVSALSPNHLIRSYRQVFGVTPHQHVMELRLREAAHLLRYSDESILTICATVGFTSPTTFSSTFRRKTGLSPIQYRHNHKLGDFEEDSSLTLIYNELKF